MGTSTPPSFPGQLDDSLANIRLSDDPLSSDEGKLLSCPRGPASIAEDLRKVSDGFDRIRGHIFEMQEKRHARHSGTSEIDVGEAKASAASSTAQGTRSDQVNAAAEIDMARLRALMAEISAQLDKTDEAIILISSSGSCRRGSTSSLSSLISFDDAFAGLNGIGMSREPTALRRQHDQLLCTWEDIRLEANALASEMEGDVYILVFEALARQAEELLDSLSKALENCHDSVFAFTRNRMLKRQSEASSHKSATIAVDEQVSSLQSVKRSFHIKRTTYEPACTRLFLTMERGIAQHATGNGTVLRRFGELQLRWQSLRERIARMDHDLGGVECVLDASDASVDGKSTNVVSPRHSNSHRLGSPSSVGTSRSTIDRRSKIPRPVFKSERISSNAVSDERPSSALSFASTSTIRTFRSFNPQKASQTNRMYR